MRENKKWQIDGEKQLITKCSPIIDSGFHGRYQAVWKSKRESAILLQKMVKTAKSHLRKIDIVLRHCNAFW